MAWVPAFLDLYGLSGNACFQGTVSNCSLSASWWCWCSHISQNHHPSSQRDPWSLSTDSVNSSTVTPVSENKGNLCPWSRSCCGTSVLGGGREKKKNRDCCCSFRRTLQIISIVLKVPTFKWWHCYPFSNWFFERMCYTSTQQQFLSHQNDTLCCFKSLGSFLPALCISLVLQDSFKIRWEVFAKTPHRRQSTM